VRDRVRGGVDGRVLIVSALNTTSSNCTHPHWNILVEHATPVLWELRCHDNSVLSRVDKYMQDGIVGYLLVILSARKPCIRVGRESRWGFSDEHLVYGERVNGMCMLFTWCVCVCVYVGVVCLHLYLYM